MTLVVDASTAIAWCIEDETTPYTETVLEHLQADAGLVPPIWPLGIANALLAAERRGRITRAQSNRGVRLLAALPINVVSLSLQDVIDAVLPIARAHGLSAYDASYVETALRLALPLATLDGRMRTAAAHLGVPLVAGPADDASAP